MLKCTAICKHGRINLIIKKGEKGYKDFAKVLNNIEKKGFFSWYGDVVNEQGKEQSGLIVTSNYISEKPAKRKKRLELVTCSRKLMSLMSNVMTVSG